MVISQRYRYVFVELPHTACTAIREELCAHYAGMPILRKHAYYHEFLRLAGEEEKTYFVFSGLRNPLDTAVTKYLKYKHNHQGTYTDPRMLRKNEGGVMARDLWIFRFIQETGADFPTFLEKFYWFPYAPYDDFSRLAHKRFDCIIRFENLQEDFARVLEMLGIEQVRPLPVVNPTVNKDDFRTYYTPATYARARWVFGPYMACWGYAFPAEWGDQPIPWGSWVAFEALGLLRTLYWRYYKWNPFFARRSGGEALRKTLERTW